MSGAASSVSFGVRKGSILVIENQGIKVRDCDGELVTVIGVEAHGLVESRCQPIYMLPPVPNRHSHQRSLKKKEFVKLTEMRQNVTATPLLGSPVPLNAGITGDSETIFSGQSGKGGALLQQPYSEWTDKQPSYVTR